MRFKQGFQTFILSVLSTILTAIPTLAAQRISTFYGLIELSVSIASLEAYAQSGAIDNELAAYTQSLDPEDLAALRRLLNQRIELNSVTLSQFLYSSMGESALEYVGKLIQTDAHQNGFYAIRSALILAADSEDLTLLNVLRQFPSDTIRVNFKAAQQTIVAFTQLFEQTEQIDAWIEQRSMIVAASPVTPSIDLQASGSWQWRVETLTLYDAQRDRELVVDLYRPQFDQPAPVLILSPGLAASRTNFAYLAQHLASHGFAVAVLDHPGSDRQQLQNLQNGAVSEVVQPSELIDRPLDISAVLDELERLNQSSETESEPFNLQQVGLLGHSFGGYTALAVAGATVNLTQLRSTCEGDTIDATLANPSLLLQCAAVDLPTETIPSLHDERIRAVFVFNPIGSSVFGADGLSQIQIPVMMVGGSQDAIAPALLEQICPFTWLTTPERYLALIQGSTHVYTAQREATALPILDSPDPLLARRYLKILSLAFAQTHVADRPEYQPYLTAAYVQLISQAPMPLRLVQSLTIAELSETINFTCPDASP